MAGINLGTLISGAFIVEFIFQAPGIGLLTLNSIYGRDYLVVEGCVLVVAVSGGNVKMGDTLAQALGAILGTAPPSSIEGATPSGKSLKDLIQAAIDADQRAQADLQRGDFAAYGKDIAAERAAVEEAAKAAGAAPTPSPSPS